MAYKISFQRERMLETLHFPHPQFNTRLKRNCFGGDRIDCLSVHSTFYYVKFIHISLKLVSLRQHDRHIKQC